MNEAPGVAQPQRRNGRAVWIVVISTIVLIAFLVSQAGAIRDALNQSASPSRAMLVVLDGSSVYPILSGLSGSDGSVRWKHQLDITYTGSLVTDGVVYVAGLAPARVDGQAIVEALRLSDGKLLWRLAFPATPATPWTVQNMLITDGLLILTVYIGQGNTGLPMLDAHVKLVAVNLSTHTEAWNVSISNFSQNWGASALATGAGLLYVGTMDGSVQTYRLSDGNLAWTTHVSDSVANDQWVWVIAVDGALLAYDSQGSLSRLRQSDGAILWARILSLSPASDAQAASASSRVILCSAGSLATPSRPVIIDPSTGATLQSYQHYCTGRTPIVSGANIYMLENFLLTVVRASDGALVWRAEPAESDLAYSNLASDNGVIFVSTVVLRYSFFKLCAHVWIASIGSCPSKTYVAAFDGATGKRYWRSADGYDALLGVGRP